MKKRIKKKYVNALARYNRCTSARAKTLLRYACKFGYGITKEDIQHQDIYGYLKNNKRVYVYTDKVYDFGGQDSQLTISTVFRIDSINLPIYSYKRERKYADTVMQLVAYDSTATIEGPIVYSQITSICSIHLYLIADSKEIWCLPRAKMFFIEPIYKSKYPKNMKPWDIHDRDVAILTSKISYVASELDRILSDAKQMKKVPVNINLLGLANIEDLQVSDNIKVPAIIATEPLE